MTDRQRVLILGASGMFGSAALRLFAQTPGCEVSGTVRGPAQDSGLAADLHGRILPGIDARNLDQLADAIARVRPDVVINGIGLVKQVKEAQDPLAAIAINALLPHQLARLCAESGVRLVHLSTDCVFAGDRGNYRETDPADALDLYGRSKHLGEVDYPGALTLRTSIIGHELRSAHSLIDWFLGQDGAVRGFRRAIFSGLPSVELASVIRDHVLPAPELRGVFHVAAQPISKLELLRLVARQYDRDIKIEPDDALAIDRSLDASRFERATGYRAPDWPELVRRMYAAR